MRYDSMPLYPALGPGEDGEACVRVPVFGHGREGPGWGRPPRWVKRVTLENPCRPGETAEVLLGVDECGSLLVCVRRDDPHCPPPRPGCCPEPCPPPRPLCPPKPCRPVDEPVCCPRPRRGRLYGDWR